MIAQKDYARLRKGERIYHFCAGDAANLLI